MKTIADYKNPFDAVLDFEKALSEFTGAPYVVVTDCCTHAIEIAFRLEKVKKCKFTPWTYLSVPMTMHKLGVNYEYTNEDFTWRGEYPFIGTRIWDSARRLEPNMFKPGQIQCISFGITKPLAIGRGGCLLTDDPELAKRASMMRFDGRDIFNYSPWASQKTFNVGFHYYLKPETCVEGLNMLESKQFTTQEEKFYNYPDCRTITIND